MIGFFPELYPDELVYSACSRYHQRMAYRSRESTATDLFGNPQTQVAIDFPSRLANLIHSYPFAQSQSVKQLINQNTQLPFYRPFVPTNRSAQVEDDMSGAGGGTIHGRLGVLTYNIRPQNLSFCPTCVEHDRAAFEETYWHRLHQLSGIDVCPDHKVFLEETGVEPRSGRLSKFFITAEQAIELVPARSVDLTKRDHQIYFWLAQNARWLLDQPALSNDGGHQERYYELLFARDLSAYPGSVKIKVLCEQIKQHYSAKLLCNGSIAALITSIIGLEGLFIACRDRSTP